MRRRPDDGRLRFPRASRAPSRWSSGHAARNRVSRTWTSRRTGSSPGRASTGESIPSRRPARNAVRPGWLRGSDFSGMRPPLTHTLPSRISTGELRLARDDEPTGCPTGVDQPLGRKTRPCTRVGEVTLCGARADAHELGGVWDASASSNAGSQDFHLALSRGSSEGPAQVAVRHARCRRREGLPLAALRLITRKPSDC